MKLDQVANSGNDEFLRHHMLLNPYLNIFQRMGVIWCPFDTEDSLFVKHLRSEGFKVIPTHIENGQDFFELIDKNPKCEYIISNPPYSMKTEVLEKLFASGKKFAMLLGVVGLFESQKRFEMFRDNQFEIMYMNRRVSYMKDFESGKTALNPPFSSVYITSGILPKKIVFEEIEKKEILFEKGAQNVRN